MEGVSLGGYALEEVKLGNSKSVTARQADGLAIDLSITPRIVRPE
jgi:hypothetical protein